MLMVTANRERNKKTNKHSSTQTTDVKHVRKQRHILSLTIMMERLAVKISGIT